MKAIMNKVCCMFLDEFNLDNFRMLTPNIYECKKCKMKFIVNYNDGKIKFTQINFYHNHSPYVIFNHNEFVESRL